VHEKAILLVIIPFSLIALNDRRHLGAFRPLAVAGHVSLFPLLFTASEFPVKVAYTIFWLMAFLLAFDRLAPAFVVPSSLLSSQPTREQITTHSNLKLTAATQFSQPTLLPLRPLLPPLHRHRHPSDRLLLTWPLTLLWRTLRIPTPDVHQLVLGRRGRGELDRVHGCLFRFVRLLSLGSPRINRVVKMEERV
jgi:hypothetical protein